MTDETRSKKKSFFTLKRIGFLLILLICFSFGMAFMYYVVEPFLSNFEQSALEKTLEDNTLLNTENLACISENNSFENSLASCESQKQSLSDDLVFYKNELIECKEGVLEE